MTQKSNSEEVDFSPGSIMLQYIDDDTRFVGMVAGEHMVSALNERDLKMFNFHDDDRHAIYLILGWFESYDKRWSIFSKNRDIRFPSYTIGDKKNATLADLSKEIELLRYHRAESTSRGLRYGKLNQSMFGFSAKQVETLEMVELARLYLAGGEIDENSIERAGTCWLYSPELIRQLRKAIPL